MKVWNLNVVIMNCGCGYTLGWMTLISRSKAYM